MNKLLKGSVHIYTHAGRENYVFIEKYMYVLEDKNRVNGSQNSVKKRSCVREM